MVLSLVTLIFVAYFKWSELNGQLSSKVGPT
jgi:hypothetical protein